MSDIKMWHEPTDMDSAWRVAKAIAQSGLAPDALRTPEAAFIAMAMGAELGLSPMASLRGVNVIKGKPSLPADLMVGLVFQRGDVLQWDYSEMTDKACTLTAQREGKGAVTLTWTIEQARKAGLRGSTWDGYARQMLKHRVDSEMCRGLWPDITQGLYTPDEISLTHVTTSAPAVDMAKIPTVTAQPALTVEPQAETPPDHLREPAQPEPAQPEPAPIAPTHEPLGDIQGFGGASQSKARQRGLVTQRDVYDHIRCGGKIDGMKTESKLWLAAKFDEPNEEPNDEPVDASVDHILVEFAEAIENARNAGIGPLDYVHAQIMESGEDIDGGLADDMMRHAAKGLGVSLASCTTEQMAEVLLKALA